jgi:hypothetical protein
MILLSHVGAMWSSPGMGLTFSGWTLCLQIHLNFYKVEIFLVESKEYLKTCSRKEKDSLVLSYAASACSIALLVFFIVLHYPWSSG